MRPGRIVTCTVLISISIATNTACRGLLGGESHTTYYAPVLRDDDNRIAYLKRLTRHCREGGGGPFAGIGQMEFYEDRLFLCVAKRDGTDESCEKHWDLPLKKASPHTWGSIEAQLGWSGRSRVRYRICLFRFDPPPGHVPCLAADNSKEGFEISNLNPGQSARESVAFGLWQVRVDPDPDMAAVPIDNSIIVDLGKIDEQAHLV